MRKRKVKIGKLAHSTIMKNILIVTLILLLPFNVMSQEDSNPAFEIEISKDTILLGNYLEVRFTAMNIKGEFEPPKFNDFEVIGGPNQSSTMRIVNGKSSQSASYSYFIKPKETGVCYIEPAYLLGEAEQFETRPTEIFCLPNPQGIVEESRITDQGQSMEFGQFPFFRNGKPSKKKKKLKVTKI